MTQFTDKSSKETFISSGLFTYPVLQAADILLYLADGVPVGEDQVQHLELSRRVARRFNSRFGEVFPEPEPLVGKKGGRIMSLSDPTAKMSKSAGESHYIGVMETETSIRKKIRSAVTDLGMESGDAMSPGVANLFEILELSTEATGQAELVEALRADFAAGTLMYSKLKDTVFEQLMEILRPIQKKRAELEASGEVLELLRVGADKARVIAKETITQVRSVVGLGTTIP